MAPTSTKFIVLSVLCVVFLSTSCAAVWNQELGLRYLYFSYAAYCSQSSLTAWNCKFCNTNETSGFKPTYQAYDRRTNIFGYGGYFSKTNTIVVAFRGTESNSLKNWIDDLKNVLMEPYKNSTSLKIGDGWYSSYNSVRSQVLSGVSSLVKQNPTAQICVTGHSLGAALAGTCAIDLVENGYRNVYVYDYGEPRIGNQAMANYLQQMIPSYYRVVNGKDIVPNLPYEVLGFRHQPTEVWENPAESMNFKVCNATNGEDPKCSDSVIRDSVYDHLHYYGIAEGCSGSW